MLAKDAGVSRLRFVGDGFEVDLEFPVTPPALVGLDAKAQVPLDKQGSIIGNSDTSPNPSYSRAFGGALPSFKDIGK